MFVVGHLFSGALLDRMLRPLGLNALCRPLLDSAMQHSWLAWDPPLVATVRQHVGAAQGCQQRLWGAHRLVQPAQAPHLRFAQAPLLQLERVPLSHLRHCCHPVLPAQLLLAAAL